MSWFRIPKDTSKKPKYGNYYWDWKPDLSIEGKEQCVYCSININSFGGIRNFHVEHYKPKGIAKFSHLENDYSNLFFACSICNGFKGDDWKNDPSDDFDNYSYPDPSKVDYSVFLSIDDSCIICSNCITGKYVINKLFLNRPQLILERRSNKLHKILREEFMSLKEIITQLKNQNVEIPSDITLKAFEIIDLLISEKYINPYLQEQIRR